MPKASNFLRTILATALAVANFPIAVFAAEADSEDFFERRVRPLLAQRCWQCHGPEKSESDLRLDTRNGVLEGGLSGPAVVPEDLEASLLVSAVRRDDDLAMPPEEALEQEEIEVLEAWVAAGAFWPDSPGSQPDDEPLLERMRREHWSLQPIIRPKVPALKQEEALGPVDAFINRRHKKNGVAANDAADQRTLLRRLYFDLIGLPPMYEEIQDFDADEAPDAYLRRVDRLLASPAHGERWGRHWLDVARYADTRGYALGGRTRRYAYAWTYRDWVIEALNADWPYDEFIEAQLAADQIIEGDDNRDLAALGFITVGRRYLRNDDTLDDRIDVVTRGLLGVTVACARCHDHKYDPIPTADYYSLYGVFASTAEPEEGPMLGDPAENAAYEKYAAGRASVKREYEDYRSSQFEQLKSRLRGQIKEYLLAAACEDPDADAVADKAALSFGADELRPALVKQWRRYLASRRSTDPVWGPWVELAKFDSDNFVAGAHEWLAACRLRRADAANRQDTDVEAAFAARNYDERIFDALLAAEPTAMSQVAEVYGDVYLAFLSDVVADAERKKQAERERDPLLAPLFFEAASPLTLDDAEAEKLLDRDKKNQLRELRKKVDEYEIASPAAPPRAMAVHDRKTPVEPVVFIRGDPARRGDPTPRQAPEMAIRNRRPFARGSGRLELAREITAPENTLTARVIANRIWLHHFGAPIVATPSDFGVRSHPPTHPALLDYLASRLRDEGWSLKRLHRELVASAAYQRSSHINQTGRQRNAASVDPENRLLWRANRRRLEFEPLLDALLAVSGRLDRSIGGRPVEGDAATRRTLYRLVDRQDLPNLFRTFDFASPDSSQSRRPLTTTPQQSLFLLNADFTVDAAECLVSNLPSDPAERTIALYRRTLGRDPTPTEAASVAYFAAQGEDAWSQAAQALLMSNEFGFVD